MSKRVDDLADVAPGPWRVDSDGDGILSAGRGVAMAWRDTLVEELRIAAALALYPELARLANAAIAARLLERELDARDEGRQESAELWEAYDASEHAADALLARIGGGQ